MPALLFAYVALAAGTLLSGTFTTYAAWSDVAAKNRGHMYIYTGNFPSTDVNLYNATTPNTAMTALYCGFPVNGVGPYQPVFEVGSCPAPATAGFGNNYFKCQSTNPIIWEVEENIVSSEEDSHDFLAAADSNNDYIGSVFMTYMRDDASRGTDYGDQIAVFNPGNAAISVNVRKWTGVPPAGSWGASVATSPSIPAKGVWMWAPSSPAAHDRGGTDGAAQGHYRFDVTGGEGMLYKGNTYAPYTAPGNRDNLIHFGPDINDGTKVGDDLLGAVVTDGNAPHIVINNQGAAAVTFEILKFNPTTAGAAGTWPMDGDDPSGSWAQVATGSIAVNQSYSFNAGALTNAGFYRVRSTNGQPLSAEFGSRILQQTWCDGDYLYASDTRRAYGRVFSLGGRFFDPAAPADPVQLHVVCPIANTTVNVVADGSSAGLGFYTSTQTNTVAEAGLAFPFARPTGTNEDWHARITANKIIYVYVMSSTDAGSTAPGETFFSVPPPIDPLLIVTKSVSQAVATLGDTLTYTLIAENPGSGSTTNSQLWDTLPPGVAFVSSVPAATLATPPLYEWNLGTILSGGSATVRITVQLNAGTQLEVKHNTGTARSDLTQPFESNDAPFTVLIPGANLVKSVSRTQAMPGDTLTYTLSYTNSAPALPGTPKLNLQVLNVTNDNSGVTRKFRINNYSGGNINIKDLKICEWIYDDANLASVSYANDYGGGTTPFTWNGPTMTGTKAAWAPPQTLPATRKANIQFCFQPATYSTQVLNDAQQWDEISQRMQANSPEFWDNQNDDYSANPGGSYVNDHHYALYYQGTLVTEYTNTTTLDPETGLEPFYVNIEDPIVGGVTYQSSTPTGAYSAPYLTWTLDSIAPGVTRSFTWWGTIPGGTPAGTVIPNDANYATTAGPGLSNKVYTLVGSATLSLVKSINKNIFTIGETVTYCFAWSNTGTAAVNVTIYDTLPAVLTYTGSSVAPSSVSGNFLVWNLGTQAANSSGNICAYGFVNSYPALPAPFGWKPFELALWGPVERGP
jgi:uncharacterized repeat protein (TIGR01451 family)